ncbi:methionine ABC transporter ATP-binding protein [Acetilactobacillus jinshanensis]|nr:ATP-binding cassette domain-containing protein [Acetilactobacillus jinshanensis]
MSESIISLQNVKKNYRHSDGIQTVLDGVNLNIPQGSVFGIIGHSGAGKSTLLRCINGLEKPTSGNVIFKGHQVNKLDNHQMLKIRSEIGMIFQQFNLLPLYTIAENVALPIKYLHLDRNLVHKKVTKVLSLVGLLNKANDYPSSLSGGQKQRAAIARALISQPKIILCDEATSALDPEITGSIIKLLKKLNQQEGITLVVVTHEMKVIEDLCDYVAVLHDGKIIEKGSVYSTFSNPQKSLTQNFVNTVIHLSIDRKSLDAIKLPEHSKLIKILYKKGTTNVPLISIISRKFNVDVNIILGDVDILQGSPFGGLLVALSGDSQNISHTLAYLKQIKSIGLKVIDND